VIQRALVRHGVDRDEIELLAQDMRRAIKHLTEGRPHSARVGFHH
jgi:glutamate decarboxylase